MKNIVGDLFKQKCDAIVITTNGFVKANGANVMGMGCAKTARDMVDGVDKILGHCIKTHGNNVNLILANPGRIALVSFPVKPVSLPYNENKIVRHMRKKITNGTIPGWACIADVDIIRRSAHQLVEMADSMGWTNVVLPRPGCGAGELSYDDIEPILQEILDDRFSVITFK